MADLDLSEVKKHLDQLEERVRRLERQKSSTVGITIEEFKDKWTAPQQRSPELVEWALAIAGIGEGPEDLSRNFRAYLREDKK